MRLANASQDAFYGGLVSFEAVKGNLKGLAQECANRNIRTGGNTQCMRIATNLRAQYNCPAPRCDRKRSQSQPSGCD